MDKLKNIKIACSFIGTMIGAGFASGREIALYFASTSPLSPLLGGVFCGVFCYIFAELGRISDGDILSFSFRKISKFTLFLIKISNFFVFCAMLAGCEYVISRLLGIKGGAIISAALILVCLYFGIERIKVLNSIVVAALIALLLIIYFTAKPEILPFQSFSFHSPILYASMNILSGGFLISKLTKDSKPIDSLKIAVIVTIVLCAFLVIIYLLIQESFNTPMPLLFTATTVGLGKIGCIILYLAIFTTLAGSLYIIVEDNMKKAVIATSLGLLISCLGFQDIIDIFYPIIGYLGAVITLYGFVKLVYRKRTSLTLL